MVLLLLCLASIVHVFFLNRPWLRWLAEDQANREAAVAAFARQVQSGTYAAPRDAALPPAVQSLGIAQGEFYGSGPAAQTQAPPPPPTAMPGPAPVLPPPMLVANVAPTVPPVSPADSHRIRVNTATLGELQAALGIAADRGQRIVQERNARGPYRSIEDFGLRSGLTPVELNRVRDLVSCEQPHSQQPSTGRLLDL
jgi:DNA uptake protein ComE-like DNA-binding protein